MSDNNAARLVDLRTVQAIDVIGPSIQFLSTEERDNDPCIIRAVLPPGVVIPLHSHVEPETFIGISGRAEGLKVSGATFEWISFGPGEVFHIPGSAKHAIRNQSKEPAEVMLATSASLGRFFREVGTPVAPGRRPAPPSAAVVQRFMEASVRYGHWNATLEENAEVGIFLTLPS
ncbi:cupin domain-containing protein [Bradyrhizobium lablabi]|uniref:cupin domain-containing protein n=1 Tax=Bradyrhizobium lablabi TaxID=722472 RepID=UPI001BA5CA38|nr:cupin domain-containing protein [Bradyrhizobium lablabi]MBR0692404.1 cupin domain-containing protein [Bradyrhizobium lablabi]